VTRQLVALKDVPKVRAWATERYLRRIVSERKIAHHKIGRRVFLDLDDVDRFAESGRVEAVKPTRLRAIR
jgi:excisionase family DNA binding protein